MVIVSVARAHTRAVAAKIVHLELWLELSQFTLIQRRSCILLKLLWAMKTTTIELKIIKLRGHNHQSIESYQIILIDNINLLLIIICNNIIIVIKPINMFVLKHSFNKQMQLYAFIIVIIFIDIFL